jgi:hypothetical protein
VDTLTVAWRGRRGLCSQTVGVKRHSLVPFYLKYKGFMRPCRSFVSKLQ